SARASSWRVEVPAKITSSILPPRRDLAPCSPITQDRASTTLDFPEPLGPTTQVIPGSNRKVVADANDLKPRSVRFFRYTHTSHDGHRSHTAIIPGCHEAVTERFDMGQRSATPGRGVGRVRKGVGDVRRTRRGMVLVAGYKAWWKERKETGKEPRPPVVGVAVGAGGDRVSSWVGGSEGTPG